MVATEKEGIMTGIDRGHSGKQQVLRVVGPLVLLVGGIFMLVGLVDFFSAFGGGGAPTKFWCLFAGMPFLFVGGALTMYGFMGSVARYAAGEMAPVAKDTFNYMADGTQEGVKTVASAIGEGLSAGMGRGGEVGVRCPKCNETCDGDAKFCDECGGALTKSKACGVCGELNDGDAKFCDECGKGL